MAIPLQSKLTTPFHSFRKPKKRHSPALKQIDVVEFIEFNRKFDDCLQVAHHDTFANYCRGRSSSSYPLYCTPDSRGNVLVQLCWRRSRIAPQIVLISVTIEEWTQTMNLSDAIVTEITELSHNMSSSSHQIDCNDNESRAGA